MNESDREIEERVSLWIREEYVSDQRERERVEDESNQKERNNEVV